ncbi:hypothetical protein DPMN_110475 [Dreissena polymorpha]|uniref:Uncharacterized protein n=1 Tax=Dreissena polymorpha TaxID=45954 RepID=A0A9D4KC34_DREPO|nr:hypothetical protein DPMN_110475 [Dreissena polymorpha]
MYSRGGQTNPTEKRSINSEKVIQNKRRQQFKNKHRYQAIQSSEVFPSHYKSSRNGRGTYGVGLFELVHKNLIADEKAEFVTSAKLNGSRSKWKARKPSSYSLSICNIETSLTTRNFVNHLNCFTQP